MISGVQIFRLSLLLCYFPVLLAGEVISEKMAYALATRYAPYVEFESLQFTEGNSVTPTPRGWWRQPATIRQNRSDGEAPLSGLHLAIDPGHIGGVWAAAEGRHFQINDSDFPVREGELVLEVAQRVRETAEALGAEITLLRESADPVNPRAPSNYWAEAFADLEMPAVWTPGKLIDHARAVQRRAVRLSIVIGELAERARIVNEAIQPDALLSLHINAAPWPEEGQVLVDSNHTHVLVFGCLSADEISIPRQRERLWFKMNNESGPAEAELGAALGRHLVKATRLPASEYSGQNAIRIDAEVPALWARNLMLLRLVDCPTVLLEPHIANSLEAYERIQKALASRAAGAAPEDDDILVEYADAIVAGILEVYGPGR